MPKSRPPYAAEFRQQIVELAQSGKTPAQLSREFGVTAQTIANWWGVKNLSAAAFGLPVGFVRVGFSADYRECPPSSPIFSGARKNGIFKLGTWGTEVHPDLGQQASDFDIVKHRVSPFYSTSLEAILRAHGIRTIYCSGISTNAVVQATVREGHDRDYEMVVLEDGCCGLSDEEHDNAIKGLQRFCRITTSQDVVFG